MILILGGNSCLQLLAITNINHLVPQVFLGPTMSCLHIMVSLLVTSVNLLLRLVGCSRVSCEELSAKPTCALPKGQAPWHCPTPKCHAIGHLKHWAEFVWSLCCPQQTSWTGYSSHFILQCNCITSLTQCIHLAPWVGMATTGTRMKNEMNKSE